jgi:hypothetical protein
VQLEVAAHNQDAFVKGALELLPAFGDVGLTVKTSAWRTNSDPVQLVNYWDIGDDADTLLNAELALPDLPGFNAFNQLIQLEVKRIVIPIGASESTPFPTPASANAKLPQDYRYLRVTTRVESASLPEFAARVEGYMARFTRDAKWLLGDTYYGITGPAGLVSQLWVIRNNDSRDIEKKLRMAPWLTTDIIKAPVTFDILRATPSDPNLDQSRDPI